jgi:hypothetical protein
MPRRASVSLPVATTTARARPTAIAVPRTACSSCARRSPRRVGGRGILGDRQRLAGEARLVDLEVLGGDRRQSAGTTSPARGRGCRPGRARGGGDPSGGLRGARVTRALAALDRGDRGLGLVALDAADHGVEGEHGGDQRGVSERAGDALRAAPVSRTGVSGLRSSWPTAGEQAAGARRGAGGAAARGGDGLRGGRRRRC